MSDDKTIIKPSNLPHNEFDSDGTVLLQPSLQVSLLDNNREAARQFSFTHHFTVGRSPSNDIVISSQSVSRHHLEVKWEKGNWWIYDLNSANGIFINNKLVEQKSLLNPPALISLGTTNIFLKIEAVSHKTTTKKQTTDHSTETAGEAEIPIQAEQPALAHKNLSKEDLRARLLAKAEAKDAGEYTRMVRKIIHEDRTAHSKSYKKVIWGLVFLFLLSVGLVAYQQTMLSNARELAIDMFYDIKTLEVSLSQAEIRLDESAEVLDLTVQLIVSEKLEMEQQKIKAEREKIAKERKRIAQERQKLNNMKAKYQQYVDEAKSLRFNFPSDALYEEELIARVARGFGESELEVPKSFVTEVKRYIEYWQKSTRIEQAMERLTNNYYAPVIIDALEKEGLPLYFMYLPLQESDYDTQAIGPETRHGIAKGAWQFLPTTGQEYGLSPGPLVNTREYDEQDDRFDFNRATQAGAKYLKYIYSTEAQASGLLVMASYNYGHTRVRNMISKMLDNPRDKNFWKFIQQHNIPKETYDYVFLIFSAAVIGEDPRHFGFNFKAPLVLANIK